VSLYQKILGIPFVYDRVRPWVLGGIDLTRLYELLEIGPNDALLDIGCGTGDALKYVSGFARYLGIDTDPVAIASAQSRFGSVANVEFACKMCTVSDIQAFKPTCVVMAGLLHHLSDESASELLNLAVKTPGVRRAVTLDIVYLDGAEHWVSNAFAALDRGRFCRRVEGYRALIEHAGVKLVSDELLWGDNQRRRARYLIMSLVG
jgi:SAM-dependent methyltransferase